MLLELLDGYYVALHRHHGCCRATCEASTWIQGFKESKKEARKDHDWHNCADSSDNFDATSSKHLYLSSSIWFLVRLAVSFYVDVTSTTCSSVAVTAS